MQKAIKNSEGRRLRYFGEKLINSRCQFNNQIHIVRLDLGLVRGSVSDLSTAPFAPVDYDKSTLCVGESTYGAKNSAAAILSVTGVYINVKGRETKRAMVARGVAERENLTAAGKAGKARVVFLKSFFFHKASYFPTQNLEKISDTTSSLTSRASESERAASALSISEETVSCE